MARTLECNIRVGYMRTKAVRGILFVSLLFLCVSGIVLLYVLIGPGAWRGAQTTVISSTTTSYTSFQSITSSSSSSTPLVSSTIAPTLSPSWMPQFAFDSGYLNDFLQDNTKPWLRYALGAGSPFTLVPLRPIANGYGFQLVLNGATNTCDTATVITYEIGGNIAGGVPSGAEAPNYDVIYFDEPTNTMPSCLSALTTYIDAAHSLNLNVKVGFGEACISDIQRVLQAGVHPDFILGEDYACDGASTYSYLQQLKASGVVKYIGMWTMDPSPFDAQIMRNRDSVFLCVPCGGPTRTWSWIHTELVYAFNGIAPGAIQAPIQATVNNNVVQQQLSSLGACLVRDRVEPNSDARFCFSFFSIESYNGILIVRDSGFTPDQERPVVYGASSHFGAVTVVRVSITDEIAFR